MQKFIIQKLDENFNVAEQISQHTTRQEAMDALLSIVDTADYVLVGIDSDGEEHLLMFR